MGNANVIIYILIAFFLLIFISQHHPPNPNHPRHRHRRLKLRSNFTLDPHSTPHPRDKSIDHTIPFDPLVAEIERKREDKQWEHEHDHDHHPGERAPMQPEWEDFIDAEDYLNDEHKFNVSERLLLLFPKIDVAPADGFVSLEELTKWNLDQSLFEVLHRTEREMQAHDKNKDGFVSFAEYEPPKWVRNVPNEKTSWWKEEHFKAADADGDGQLNITEFNDFLHPADTSNPKLLQWLCKEELRATDTNKDGKVDLKEFYHGPYDLVRNYDEEDHHETHHTDQSSETAAKKVFDDLDKDKDGYLNDEEMFPIIGKLHPTERFYALQQANYAIQQADLDRDGRLTLEEMIENPYAFYNAIHEDDEYDEDDYEYHDEFR